MDESIKETVIKSLDHLDEYDLMALDLIISERIGQLEREGWSPSHDAHHRDGELAGAAAAYAKSAYDEIQGGEVRCPSWWPWSKKWWKPYGFQRNLERSGALLLAEISKMLRSV